MNVIRHALLWLSGITGAFLMYLYISQGYGTTQRFALADVAARSESDANYVDPNMTAIGLMMCVIVAIPVLLNTGSQGVRRNVNRLTAVAVIGCALFFESRTSALSLIIGVAFGIMRAGSGMGRGRKALKRAAVIGAMLLVAGLLNRSGMQAIVDRMQNVQLDTTTASGRISLFEDAFRDWSSSNKSVILGNGYYVSNPHNELIRSLDCDGIIGLTAFVTLMMGVYMVCCRGPQYSAEQILSQNVLFAYIVSAMMTYGHTKTMWLAYLFLLAGYLEAEARGLRFRKGAAVRVGQFGVPGRLKAVSQGS